MEQKNAITVAILIFDEVDLLDVGGPYEVFLTASRLKERNGELPDFEVVTFSLNGEPVVAFGGLGLQPSNDESILERTDILIVPGAIAINRVLENRALTELVRRFHEGLDARGDKSILASVCTGAFVLADAGLLNEKPWTTHWEDIDVLAQKLGTDTGTKDERYVDAGDIVTSGGLACGIDMSLWLVERLAGETLAQQTRRQLDLQ